MPSVPYIMYDPCSGGSRDLSEREVVMRTRIALFLAVMFAFVAIPNFVPAVQAQAPETSAEYRALLDDITATAHKITEAEQGLDALVVRKKAWEEKYTRHEAKKCVWTNSYEECRWYDDEAAELNREDTAIRTEGKKLLGEHASLSSHLAVQISSLKIARILVILSEWEQRVVACTKLPWETATKCLNDEWERHP